MTALQRLRALRISEMHLAGALTELTKAPSVSFVIGQAGAISENMATDPAPKGVSDAPPAPLNAPRWLAAVAAHLDAAPASLITAGVILPDEVSGYTAIDPVEFANALRRAHPNRFPESDLDVADDRRHCATCQNLNGTRCRASGFYVLDDLPRRCLGYLPMSDDPDQRSGRARWSSLLSPVEVYES